MSSPNASDGDPKKPSLQIKLQERDRALLGVFRDLRFLKTSHLQSLLVPSYFPSVDAFRARLVKLKNAGLVTVVAYNRGASFRHDTPRPKARPENIWAISNSGAKAIGLVGEFDKNNRRLSGNDPFTHPFLITDAYVALAAGERAGAFELFDWKREQLYRKGVRATYKGDQKKLDIIPDASFDLADDQFEMTCFLECDAHQEPIVAGSLERSSVFKHCLGYHYLWLEMKRQDPHAAFFVYTLTKSEARADALTEAARRADPRGRGLDLFRFASAECFSLENPTPFWDEPIWRTPSGERRKLFE